VWLKATAGLRMLEKSQSEAVLASVRAYLSLKENSPFLFRPQWAKVISGNEEGGFGWIAFNYLKKIIGPKKIAEKDREAPYAVVEMGGASAQVSQLAPTPEAAAEIPPEHKFSFTIEKDSFHLYTHSYLGFGAEQSRELLNKKILHTTTATDKVISDPCLNPGYNRDTSTPRKEPYEGPQGNNFSISGVANSQGICTTALEPLFKNDNCKTEKELAAAASLSFNCVFQPSFIRESKNVLVFENFYYMSSAIGVKPFVSSNNSKTSFPLITNAHEIKVAANKLCGKIFKIFTLFII
jgi:Golgi nucleoside diphosphatase